MPLKVEVSVQILREAHALWEDFCDSQGTEIRPDTFFQNRNWKLTSKVFYDFFNLCASILVADPQIAYPQILAKKDLAKARDPALKNRAVSWLTSHRSASGELTPIILLDTDHLERTRPVQMLALLKTKLILHEIGHLRHWDALFGAVKGPSGFAEARPEQESEAWWFCYAILGLTLAMHACHKKSDPNNADWPSAWELLSPETGRSP